MASFNFSEIVGLIIVLFALIFPIIRKLFIDKHRKKPAMQPPQPVSKPPPLRREARKKAMPPPSRPMQEPPPPVIETAKKPRKKLQKMVVHYELLGKPISLREDER